MPMTSLSPSGGDSTRCEPMKPAAPVTAILNCLSILGAGSWSGGNGLPRQMVRRTQPDARDQPPMTEMLQMALSAPFSNMSTVDPPGGHTEPGSAVHCPLRTLQPVQAP